MIMSAEARQENTARLWRGKLAILVENQFASLARHTQTPFSFCRMWVDRAVTPGHDWMITSGDVGVRPSAWYADCRTGETSFSLTRERFAGFSRAKQHRSYKVKMATVDRSYCSAWGNAFSVSLLSGRRYIEAGCGKIIRSRGVSQQVRKTLRVRDPYHYQRVSNSPLSLRAFFQL
jgi:hypothetical protein